MTPRQELPRRVDGLGMSSTLRYAGSVESRGTLEFRYADGRVVTGTYEDHAGRLLSRGDGLEFDDTSWVMYDRVDRAGVTFYLCQPADSTTVDGDAETVTRLRDLHQAPGDNKGHGTS